MGIYNFPEPQGEILMSIASERVRQERLKAEGKFKWSCADDATPEAKFAVLSEEVGEVARHVSETLIDAQRYDPLALMKELTQVAAVCTAWCEAITKEIRNDQTMHDNTRDYELSHLTSDNK